MENPIFVGSCVAIITPFNENGINFDKLKELIEFQIKEQSDAILICGTTGEASTMPDEEHKSAIKFAVDTVNKRVPVLAGTGSNDTNHAIELSKYAQEIGADAILSVTPYYNKTTQQGLYCHFKAIAESVSIPVILYNVPTRTSLNISPETVYELSLIDNIVGLKECNVCQVGEIINMCGENFSVYSGNDDLVVPYLSLGGKGVISASANVIPNKFHTMVHSFVNGDIKKAQEIQLNILKLFKTLFIEVSPIPIKAAMNLMGMDVGKCRLPLVDISDKNLEILKNVLKEYNLIKG